MIFSLVVNSIVSVVVIVVSLLIYYLVTVIFRARRVYHNETMAILPRLRTLFLLKPSGSN